MALSEFFSSFLPTVYADAPEEKEEVKEEDQPEGDQPEEAPEAEAEEEEEPEDILPGLLEECEQSAQCASATKHFQHCEEKIHAGQGYKGEDCIEEFMMHCVNGCVAPKLFSKLK